MEHVHCCDGISHHVLFYHAADARHAHADITCDGVPAGAGVYLADDYHPLDVHLSTTHTSSSVAIYEHGRPY